MIVHAEFTSDETGNAGLIGLWEVPDDFSPSETYEVFCAGFKAAHPTRSGNLNARQRVVQGHAWIKHLDKAFKRVEHVTR